jgi:gamma-glutamylcyclotransferase
VKYTLQPRDERSLDRAEGVPWAYEKRELDVEILSTEGIEGGGKEGGREVVKALVYVDEQRIGVGACKEEYVARINKGLGDARAKGMPVEWVERVVRRFVREEDVPGEEMEDPFHPEKGGDVGAI